MPDQLSSQIDGLLHLYVLPIGWRLIGALVIWVIGSWSIKLLRAALHRALRVRQFDVTLATYLDKGVGVVLRLLVLIAVLGVLGVETTSFAALLAAAGIAIGAAWSGLLAHFAAGLFLMTFRPFRVGDVIAAAGISGTVTEIGLFVTAIDTADGVRTFVGNNRLFADSVQNFSVNECRRVDLTAHVLPGANLERTIERLRETLPTVPNVRRNPPPQVEILTFSPTGPVLAVRPFCHHAHYWQVYFDASRLIGEALSPDQSFRRAS
jgi:small conductance mechanosensitive channel